MRGFDLVHEMDLACVDREPNCEPLRGLRRAVLIGNTRALWPVFLDARRDEPDPLDRYTERVIEAAYPGARIWFAHRAYDAGYLPFSRIAAAGGLAALVPATQLLIHPTYGPWFGLRALVALDGDAVAPSQVAYACSRACSPPLGSTDWRDWLAMRDACCVGRAYRYSDDQIAYHYTKDPAHLRLQVGAR